MIRTRPIAQKKARHMDEGFNIMRDYPDVERPFLRIPADFIGSFRVALS
jgi:hypothetical protein